MCDFSAGKFASPHGAAGTHTDFELDRCLGSRGDGRRKDHILKGRPWLSREFDRERYGWNLKQAWFTARQAQLTAKQRRADSIRAEIDALKYKSFQTNIEPARQQLERELAALA